MAELDADATLAEVIVAYNNLQNKVAAEHPDEACPPEECVQPAAITEGQNLIVSDPDTDCNTPLASKSNKAIPVVDGSTVENHDGSAADPIQLDGLDQVDGDFKGLMALKADGTFQHWTPLNHDARHKLTTQGDTISQTLDKTVNEFLSGDVEVVCCNDMTYVIGAVTTVNAAGQNVLKLVAVEKDTFYSCVCRECNVASYDDFWNINNPA